MGAIPEEYEDLFERKTFAHVATLMEDGTPQVTPVWVDYDGEYLMINTARGRQKERNLTRDPKVGVSILDPEDPYTYLSIRGEVAEITEEGAVDHIDELARRYMDVEEYPFHDEEGGERVIVKIRPDRVITGQ
ncbi:pyridoxamine 5'-phosphate oxidase [Halalkalicoccus paucihalophilus]|uniref:Pyridoxamine 5'-phosphate oxidase n=1 Tax=Halalkalicoccus paucihalophilus TaxID=1008153 RepID=A0A151AJE4_9EURY|nr:PPOX class F420-dependent oxidoreductase [Halalkalicoccus paucihalophilus]KYH27734.1 pyridoxamine 5'-phosphate oxidase [Halalkalicoccus paucihalophilus]